MSVIDVFHAVPRNWKIVVGLTFTYLWTWLIYWGGPFVLRGQSMELANGRWAGNVVMCALAIGAIALAVRRGAKSAPLVAGIRTSALASALVSHARETKRQAVCLTRAR